MTAGGRVMAFIVKRKTRPPLYYSVNIVLGGGAYYHKREILLREVFLATQGGGLSSPAHALDYLILVQRLRVTFL